MSILPASETDMDAICLLLNQLFSQEADFAADKTKQMRAVTEILSQPDSGQILILRKDGQVAGMVSLLYLISTAMGGKVALLEDMIIAEGYRGRGLGQELLTAAIDFARQQGCLRITLLTDADNDRAQQFYQKHGFSHSAMVPMRRIFED
ncbi:MAG: GNAT family N-acetyltransferase [Methylophaga sp.]|nr:GNAT family N-acetyltransferase [Methylophaga sp.]